MPFLQVLGSLGTDTSVINEVQIVRQSILYARWDLFVILSFLLITGGCGPVRHETRQETCAIGSATGHQDACPLTSYSRSTCNASELEQNDCS